MLNVWHYRSAKGFLYFVKHPIKYMRNMFAPFKWSWQRIIRGYADCDIWDMDRHLLKILPAMLEHLADSTEGYPQFENTNFASLSEWQEYLKNIAMHFRNSDEDTCPEVNEFEPMYIYCGVDETKHTDGTVTITSNAPESIRKKYWNRIVEITKWREREAQKAFEMLAPVLFALWS